MIDFHNHLMPGVDDGAATIDEAREALKVMWEQGVRTIITTPHLSASLTLRPAPFETYLRRLDVAWEALTTLGRSEFPDLQLERGTELLLDSPKAIVNDSRVRLAGTRFILVEFPFIELPPNSDQVLFNLKIDGFAPVVAHPERYRQVCEDISLVATWRRVGAHIQVNSGSLCGAYGERARTTANELLMRGWADYVSSDYHGYGTCYIELATNVVKRLGGARAADILTHDNAALLVEGKSPLEVGAVTKGSWLSWLLDRILSKHR
jgi:protein-tyrosine phosphatase